MRMDRAVLSGQNGPCFLYLCFVFHKLLVYRAGGRSGISLAILPVYVGSGEHAGCMRMG